MSIAEPPAAPPPSAPRFVFLRALATDYDGTLAHDGAVPETTIAALQSARQAGLRLILVSGRQVPELLKIFPQLAWFDLAVMENGAVLYDPQSGGSELLAGAPPSEFVKRLHELGLPLQLGQSIVATWEPHETEVLEAIKEFGLELQVIFNKGNVMILPSGVNKATGLRKAVEKLGLDVSEVAGVGDAENDHAFLKVCGLSVAVANALPSIKEEADMVTKGDHGTGVEELIAWLLAQKQPIS